MARVTVQLGGSRRWGFVLAGSISVVISACSPGYDRRNPLHIDASPESAVEASAEMAASRGSHRSEPEAPERGPAPADGTPVAYAAPARPQSGHSPVEPTTEADERRAYGHDCSSSGCHDDLQKTAFVHAPAAVAACEACHEESGDADAHRYQLSTSARRLCTQCHRSSPLGPYDHEPYAQQDCLVCHDPHGGATKHFLRRSNDAQLCGKCHGRSEHEIPHGPYAVGECTVCHTPHRSSHKHLLRAPTNELCTRCHTQIEEELAGLSYVHGPVLVDCSSCHDPHGATNRNLLRREEKELCLGCHTGFREKLEDAARIHGALGTDTPCTACHTPHGSALAMQLRAIPGELCLGCHDRELLDSEGRLVVSNVAAQIDRARFKHGPVRTGDCQGCHRPHFSTHPKLLREAYPSGLYEGFSLELYALCFRCHEKDLVLAEQTRTLTGFRDGEFNLHYVHVNRSVKGRTCGACHDPHGSSSPHHVRESVPFGKMGWKLPLNFVDTETGGSCRPGCHDPAAYDAERPIGGLK